MMILLTISMFLITCFVVLDNRLEKSKSKAYEELCQKQNELLGIKEEIIQNLLVKVLESEIEKEAHTLQSFREISYN